MADGQGYIPTEQELVESAIAARSVADHVGVVLRELQQEAIRSFWEHEESEED